MVQDYKFRQSEIGSRRKPSVVGRALVLILAVALIGLAGYGVFIWLGNAPDDAASTAAPTPALDANTIPLALPPIKPDPAATSSPGDQSRPGSQAPADKQHR